MTAPDRTAIARGHDLERAVMAALGSLPGVVVHRNDVREVLDSRTGGRPMTGLGGKGAPDLLVEVVTAYGLTCAVWLECKAGDGAKLNPHQRKWHSAATMLGRHAYVVRSVEHARAIVESFRRGVVYVG